MMCWFAPSAKKNTKLSDHRLYAKMSKCEFWLKQATFMSHVISEEGISVDSSKIQDIIRDLSKEYPWIQAKFMSHLLSKFPRISRIL
jgi:hypothetical protein